MFNNEAPGRFGVQNDTPGRLGLPYGPGQGHFPSPVSISEASS